MKSTVTFILLVALLFGLTTATTNGGKGHKDKEEWKSARMPHRYIIKFKDSLDHEQVEQDLKKIGAKGNFDVKISKVYRHVMSGVAVEIHDQHIDKIRSLPTVLDVFADGNFTIESTRYGVEWGLDRLDQHEGMGAFDGKFDPQGDVTTPVYVYVIDSGINPLHEDFGGRAEAWYDAVGDGRDGIDCNGHGTHCAGIVGSKTYGVATNAQLRGVRVIDCWGTGEFSSVLDGIEQVLEKGDLPGVVSISLKTWASNVFDGAVQKLVEAGYVVSVAAGNGNSDACAFSPARMESVLTVAATDFVDKRYDLSNYGPCVDIFAPGTYIMSTWIDSTTDAVSQTGTSMACPFVSGFAALLLGQNPSMTPAQVKNTILSIATKDKVRDLNGSPNRLLFVDLKAN